MRFSRKWRLRYELKAFAANILISYYYHDIVTPDQIDELADKGIITTGLKELAHTIRVIGNDGAHPNELDVDEQDSKEVLELAEQLLDLIFVSPARVKEIQEKRKEDSANIQKTAPK